MKINQRNLVLLAAGGSAALLLGAFIFQMLGYAPCKMCIWQRWPHGAAIAIGIIWMIAPVALVLLAGAIAAGTTGTIGFYHMGVEKSWFAGPDTCTSSDITNLSTDDLMAQIMSAPLVRCDEVAWEFLTISMAGWNMLISFALAVIWLTALRKSAAS